MADTKRDDDAKHETKHDDDKTHQKAAATPTGDAPGISPKPPAGDRPAAPVPVYVVETPARPDPLASEPEVKRIEVSADVMNLAYLLEEPPEVLANSLDGKLPDGTDDPNATPLTEGQIAGLLETERSGKNRTDIVKVLCDRLKIATPYEVTSAGPNYTNPVNRDVVAPVTPPA
jgi:hypothetical protein